MFVRGCDEWLVVFRNDYQLDVVRILPRKVRPREDQPPLDACQVLFFGVFVWKHQLWCISCIPVKQPLCCGTYYPEFCAHFRMALNLGLFDPHNTGVFVVRVYNPVSLGHHRVVLEMQVAVIGSVAYIMLLEQVSKSLHTKSIVFIES